MNEQTKQWPKTMKRSDEGDAPKWWRNPYCWLILVGPITVIFAGFITMYIAIVGADTLVDENYYQKGIALSNKEGQTPESLLPAKQARNHAATVGVSTAVQKPVK
jgi:uncharacterized protein